MNDEVTSERCRQIVESWKVPLPQIRVVKQGKEKDFSIYLDPSNAVDMAFDDPRRKKEVIAYLLSVGVTIDET